MGQHHDSAPSLNYTVLSIDSLHMRKDGSNYLKFLLRVIFSLSDVKCNEQLTNLHHQIEIIISSKASVSRVIGLGLLGSVKV